MAHTVDFKYSLRMGYGFIWGIVTMAITPIILLQVLFFLAERAAEVLFSSFLVYSKKERTVVPFDKLTVSVVIPNWNGIGLLKKCLASIYEADGFKEGKYEVLIVDDASECNIAERIKDDFPQTRVIRNNYNRGFGRSCNRGIREAKGELIVLLNNDIMVSREFLAPLKGHFRDKDVFAVSPKLYYWDKNTFNYGMHMGEFKGGYLSLWNESETGNGDRVAQAAPTIFAVGGAMCFRKRDFLWLGGFDDIYRPNCWEDIDISYRAQKRGLKVLYEPKSLLYHKGAATLNYLRHKEIKNELLFMWKNLTGMRMLMSHFNQLPKFLYRGRHSTRIAFLIGYLWAFDYLIPALINRFRERRYLRISDKRILGRCMLYYTNFLRNNYIHSGKKTVLLITPFIVYPLNSGGKLRIYNLYKRLSKKYNLVLLSLIHHENEEGHARYLKEIFNAVYTVHTKTPSNEFLLPKRYKYSFSSFLIERLREIQEKYPIDLVHIESGELLYLTKYIKHIPIVYTEHDISILSYRKSYYKKDMDDSLSGFIDYLKVVRYHHSVYDRIDKVVALSKEDIKVIRVFSPQSDCSLVPTGVDLGHFAFQEKSGKKSSLIFVGHYQHYPNEEAAVYFCRHIFPIIKKAIPEATLKLVGSDPSEAVIKLSQIDGVEVIGNVPDVNPFLQEASIFVCPFKRSAGIKGKVLEAMATGTPVVCTTRGAYGINAINGSSILIADKAKVFAKSVIGLLRNDGLYQRLARNARLLVEENYDWERIVKQLDRVYRDVMGDDGPVLKDTIKETPKQVISHDKAGAGISLQGIIKKTEEIVGLSLGCLSRDGDTKTNLNPQELHIELTHLCNSKCITCDIWDYHQRNNKSVNDELTLPEIRDFINNSKRLKGLKTVVLSGGEPFLRPDFVDICVFIKDILPRASLGILTNGMDTETIVSKTKDILKRVKPDSLWIGSSLDGLGHAYDKVRGTPGGFFRFLKTVERFKEELPDIAFSTTLCLTPFNMDQLIPCWEFADKYGLGFSAQFGVPKSARSPEVFQWQEKDFIRIKEYIEQIIEKIITKNTDLASFHKSLTNASNKINLLTQIYYWAHLVDFQRTGKRPSYRCHAGFKFAMFDAYGNMFFCPLLKDKTIGNIREEYFDQLWSSSEAGKVRGFIDSGECSCWLLCTVFPMVGEALSLYGDKVAASLWPEPDSGKTGIKLQSGIRQALINTERVDNFAGRKGLLGPVAVNIMPDVELNNTEFRERAYILGSTPQGVTIGANYGCNANCIFCLEGEYKPFTLDLYKNYFEPRLGFMLNRSAYVSLCGMGELLLIPEIEETLGYLNDKLPDKNKILTTNGLALNNKILERITKSKYSLQVSLHSSSPSLHEYLTGIKGGFERVIKQIRSFVVKRKDRQCPYITLVFVINTMNIEDLPDFIELAVSLGVDCVQCNYLTIFKPSHLKLSCFFKQEATNQMLDIATEKANALKITLILPPRFSTKEYFNGVCSEPWKNIYVDTEGAVLPCCYSGEHFGELEKDDILSIWNNDKFKQIRMGLASGANPIAMCKYCLNNKPGNVNHLNAHISFRPEVQKAIFEQN